MCASELAAPCRALGERFPELDVRVEPAGTTLDALPIRSAPAPLWATLQPFPEMVDVLRPHDPVGYTTEPLAASQLTIATAGGSGRSDALGSGCEGDALWACIGAHAGAPWTELGGDPSLGTIRPSVGLVEREAVALASFANAVAGYFGTPDVDPAAFGDASFLAWLRRLAGAVHGSAISAGTPLATMVTQGRVARHRRDHRRGGGIPHAPRPDSRSTSTTLSSRCGSRRCWPSPEAPPPPTGSPTR